MDEARYQNVARMGMLVSDPKNAHVRIPPLTWRARYAGPKTNKVPRRRLEKLSLLAESAGKGAFLIEGYYWQ